MLILILIILILLLLILIIINSSVAWYRTAQRTQHLSNASEVVGSAGAGSGGEK